MISFFFPLHTVLGVGGGGGGDSSVLDANYPPY